MGIEHGIFESRPALEKAAANVCRLIFSSKKETSPSPRLTIAIPTYRRPGLLREALFSATKQITKHPYNIIIIDNDSSPDISAEVDELVRSSDFPDVSLFRNSDNVGMFGNWNRCLCMSTAPWVSILNDDDLLCAGFVETICGGIDEHAEADFFQVEFDVLDRRVPDKSVALKIDVPRPSHVISKRISWLESVLANHRAGSLGIAFRTKLANEIGGFDAREYPTADYCFNLRMLMSARLAIHFKVKQAVYRVEENESLKTETLQGFVQNDFVLRMQAASLTRFPVLVRMYAKNIAVVQIDRLRDFWGVRVPLEKLESSLGIKLPRARFGVFISRIISGILIRFLRRFG